MQVIKHELSVDGSLDFNFPMAQNQQQQHHLSQQAHPNSHNISYHNNTVGNNNTPEPLNTLNDPAETTQTPSQVVMTQHGQFANRPSVTPPSWVH